MTGRKFWISYKAEPGLPPVNAGPFVCKSVKQFLPAGVFEKHNYAEGVTYTSERKRSLVQLHTDGGLRTVAVAELWTKDPGKSDNPW